MASSSIDERALADQQEVARIRAASGGRVVITARAASNATTALVRNCTTYGTDMRRILGIPYNKDEEKMNKSKVSYTVAAWNKLYTSHSWIDWRGTDWIVHLAAGTIVCRFCLGKPGSRAEIQAIKHTAELHELSDTHALNASALTGQSTITESFAAELGKLQDDAEANERARFQKVALTALYMSEGIPLAAAERIMTPAYLALVRGLVAPPSRATMITELAPAAAGFVRQGIKHDIRGVVGALHADGGSTDLINGCQVIVFMFSSPALERDVFLGAETLADHHENGKDIAAAARKFTDAYNIAIPTQVAWLCGDNWTGNPKAAREVGVPFAACAPHGLALCITALLEALDENVARLCVPANASKGIGIETFLRACRRLVNANGSKTRKNDFVQWGLSLAALDIVTTRWTSVLLALEYLAGTQREYDMKRAKRLLQHLGDHGGGGAALPDADAAKAAAEPSAPASVWAVLWDFFDVLEVKNTDEEGKTALPLVCYWLCNPHAYAHVVAITRLMEGVPKLLVDMQGNADDVGASTLGARIVGLLRRVEEAQHHPDDLIAIVEDRLRKRLEEAAARLVKEGKANDALSVRRCIDERVAEACAALREAVPKACHAFLAKRSHIDGTIAHLKVRELFSTHAKPRPTDPTLGTAAAQLGLPRDAPAAEKFAVAEQWAQYVAEWPGGTPPMRADPGNPEKLVPPPRSDVYKYWADQRDKWPALSKWALRLYSFPVGNARTEGVMSIITNMGAPNRQSMQEHTFQNELCVRANKPYVGVIARVAVDTLPKLEIMVDRSSGARETGRKRKAAELSSVGEEASRGAAGGAGAAADACDRA